MSDLYYFKSLEGIVHNTDTLKFLLKLNKTYGYKVFSQQYSKSQWAESDIDVVESIFIEFVNCDVTLIIIRIVKDHHLRLTI